MLSINLRAALTLLCHNHVRKPTEFDSTNHTLSSVVRRNLCSFCYQAIFIMQSTENRVDHNLEADCNMMPMFVWRDREINWRIRDARRSVLTTRESPRVFRKSGCLSQAALINTREPCGGRVVILKSNFGEELMFDAKRLLDQLVGSGAAGGFAGGLAGGALANVLAGKKGRKVAGSAMKLGGLALVGGLAYKAWQTYQQGAEQPSIRPMASGVEPPPADGAFMPRERDAAGTNSLSILLARAMISAAKADGQIDTQESQAILNQINGLDLPAEDKAFLFEEYGRPLDIAALTGAVHSMAHAAEVYAASVLMVDPPSSPEKIYLDTLANALGLEAGMVQQIHATVVAEHLT